MNNHTSEIKNPHEREVAEFMIELGFDLKKTNPIIAENKKQIGEIDSIFEYDDCLFLVEVSLGKRLVNEKKNFFFSKWSDEYNLKILRNQCGLKTKKVIRIYFDLAKDDPENHEGLDHITVRKKGNKAVYLNTYKKFVNELNENKRSAQENFLKWLDSGEETLPRYNKAVRDKIPEIIDESGNICNVKALSDYEFLAELEKKLEEETKEYQQSKSVEELADILEVVYRISQLKGTSAERLEEIRQEKAQKRGAFEKNLFLIDAED